MSSMPKIDLRECGLTGLEYALCIGILNPHTLQLRASKPPVPNKIPSVNVDAFGLHTYYYENENDRDKGRTAYIWRMVAFMVSPMAAHQCMPVTAEFDLDGTFDSRREEAKRLDAIVDKVVNSIPVSEWHGVRRWGRALGYGG